MSIFTNNNSTCPLTPDSSARYLSATFISGGAHQPYLDDYLIHAVAGMRWVRTEGFGRATIVSDYDFRLVCFCYNVPDVSLDATIECPAEFRDYYLVGQETSLERWDDRIIAQAQEDAEHLRSLLSGTNTWSSNVSEAALTWARSRDSYKIADSITMGLELSCVLLS